MDLTNPRITIQNVEGGHWLVRFEHDFGNGEAVDITVKVPRSDMTMTQLTAQVYARAGSLLATLASRTGS